MKKKVDLYKDCDWSQAKIKCDEENNPPVHSDFGIVSLSITLPVMHKPDLVMVLDMPRYREVNMKQVHTLKTVSLTQAPHPVKNVDLVKDSEKERFLSLLRSHITIVGGCEMDDSKLKNMSVRELLNCCFNNGLELKVDFVERDKPDTFGL